jgi:shikimate kinase
MASGRARRFHVVLVGLPGSGKSTVGPVLARQLDAEFMDLDREIETRQRMSVAEIFASRGEPAFREMERELTRELAARPPMVLSPGGGWMADPINVDLLRPPARIIHLEVSPRTAIKRLGPDIAKRPLLAGPAVVRQMETISAVRLPLYSRADEAINTENITPQEVADFGLRLAYAWGWPIG